MRLFFFLLVFYSPACRSQAKEQIFHTYFLDISVSDSFEANREFLKESSLFGIDSIQKGSRIFSSYKGKAPFFYQGIENIVVLLEKQVWQDSVTKEFYDTASILSIEFLFNKNDKKSRDDFYEKLQKEFGDFYPYEVEKKLSGKYNAQYSRFTQNQFDNYAELILYKGYVDNQFHYVTLRYDKRKYYQVRDPEVFIRVTSF